MTAGVRFGGKEFIDVAKLSETKKKYFSMTKESIKTTHIKVNVLWGLERWLNSYEHWLLF